VKLEKRQTPLQNITISRMPISVYEPLQKRASKLCQSVPVYCRIILEHALKHKDEYSGAYKTVYADSPCHSSAVTIPLLNKEFKVALKEWDPYGVEQYTKIALSIVKKHLEVKPWEE
jgi:hypothetical protein